MPGCAAIGCNNRSEKGYTMKCFPRNPNLRRIWKERVSRADWEPSNNSFLCHVHFDSDQWILSQNRRLKLKKNAIPSIFTVTSTRKSPRKRRKLLNGENQDLDYLDESVDPIRTVENTIRDSFSSQYGAKAIKKSNGMHDANSPRIEREVAEIMANSEPEMKPQEESTGKLLLSLWLASGGETGTNEELDYANGCENGSKYSHELLRENGESISDKEVNEANIRDAIDRKRKSRYEIMRDIEKTVGVDVKPDVNVDASRNSKFTIKVTGFEDDVEEIVEGLGTEQFKYKTSDESSKNNRRFVTSVISVIENSSSTSTSILKKPKLEIDASLPSDTEIDSNFWPPYGDIMNLRRTAFMLNDDKTFLVNELREKMKYQQYQKDVIRKLTDQLMIRVDAKNTPNSADSKRQTRESTMNQRNDNVSDSVLNALSTRLNNLEELNKSLNKKLLEKEKERKKFELQIRQRDNRIKELNWKLEKASKYVERAEKNTITYRKKMINMQSLIARRKLLDEKMDNAKVEHSENISENRVAQAQRGESIKFETVEDEKCVAEEQNCAENNSALYRTVQDIFDESNDCDDDPCVIDTREDFMRQFKDTFEPRV